MSIIAPWWIGDPIGALTINLLGDQVKVELSLDHAGKEARTECCCQSVAFMIAAIVVPLGSCSIAALCLV